MKKYIIVFTAVLGLVFGSSCTDLEEDTAGRLTGDSYFNTEDEIISGWLRVFFHMQANWNYPGFGAEFLDLYYEGTDMAVVIQNAGRQDDGYHYEWHKHNFSPDHYALVDTWNQLYQGIGQCSMVIDLVENANEDIVFSVVTREQVIGDLKCYRAWMYKYLIDFFGDVPIIKDVDDKSTPNASPRKEVYEYIVKDIEASIPHLAEKNSPNWYGHYTKGAARALLAKLYLNAEVYGGNTNWDRCVELCKDITTSGHYSLDENWDGPFRVDGVNSNENIFSLEYGKNGNPTFGYMIGYNLPYAYYNAAGVNASHATDKFMTHKSFLDKFDDEHDLRFNQWLFDTVKYNGQVVMENNKPLVLDAEITKGLKLSDKYDGARCAKFQVNPESPSWVSENDFPVFRYADVLLVQAEALMRKNDGSATQEAVDLVNQVRKRAYKDNFEAHGKYSTATLTMDELLDERARELTYEPHRREDLIRFGKFQDAWWGKEAEASDRSNLMPIPNIILSSNPNLKQNKGY
jgi:hypothetical protein